MTCVNSVALLVALVAPQWIGPLDEIFAPILLASFVGLMVSVSAIDPRDPEPSEPSAP